MKDRIWISFVWYTEYFIRICSIAIKLPHVSHLLSILLLFAVVRKEDSISFLKGCLRGDLLGVNAKMV